jgi:YD repeat-containing protein
MVAIVSGNGFGLANSSAGVLGQSGLFGNATLGNSKEAAYVNIANGSLTLQDTDDFLAERGIDIALTRTYNSLGSFSDRNGAWKVGPSRQVTNLTGTLNTIGSTVTRIDSDGSSSLYTYDPALGLYRSTDGGGGYDSLSMNGSNEWVWTSDRQDVQGLTEVYDSLRGGYLSSVRDQSGVLVTYKYNQYTPGQLFQITHANGNTVYYDYTGNNLSGIRTLSSNGIAYNVYYAYDSSDRLTGVTLDLTPGDSDTQSYVTTYTYRGASNQITSVTQSDGTKLTFGYTQVPATTGPWLLTSVTDGLSQVTNYNYAVAGATTVTDPLGYKTVYNYDTKNQLTAVTAPAVAGSASQVVRYEYDAKGNVIRAVDAQNQATVYQYDGTATASTNAMRPATRSPAPTILSATSC